MSNLFTVNHGEAGGVFEPLPIGEYECIISEVKVGKSQGEKTNGADMLELVLTVREDIDQPGKKRKFFDRIIFAPQLAWKVQQFYMACAFENGTKFNNINDVARAVAYRSIRVKNRHEEYNGQVRDRVDAYLVSKSPLKVNPNAGADPFATGPAQATGSNSDVPF